MSHHGSNEISSQLSPPLTNLQMELLTLYGTDLPDEDLHEVKQLLAHFFAKKALREADRVWDEQNLTNEDMDSWLNE